MLNKLTDLVTNPSIGMFRMGGQGLSSRQVHRSTFISGNIDEGILRESKNGSYSLPLFKS